MINTWRVVDANKHIFMNSSKPIGPKKYTKISMSPKIEIKTSNWRLLLAQVNIVRGTNQQTSIFFHQTSVATDSVNPVNYPWLLRFQWWEMEGPKHTFYRLVSEFSLASFPMLLVENPYNIKIDIYLKRFFKCQKKFSLIPFRLRISFEKFICAFIN